MSTEPIQELEVFLDDANALAVEDKKRAELIATLQPLAKRIEPALRYAATCEVTNEAQAKDAANNREMMIQFAEEAEKSIRAFDDNLLERMFKAHRKGTTLIGRFLVLLDAAKTVKQKVMSWQQREAEKAEAEMARLQSELDVKAARERERLEKEAAKLKTPALREQRMEEAAQVVPAVVHVAVPPKAVRSQTRWKVKSVDMTAMGIPKEVQGYVEIKVGNLERSKAANSLLEVPGVQFHQVLV